MSSLDNLQNYTKAITFIVLEEVFNCYLKSILGNLNVLCCVIIDVICELKKDNVFWHKTWKFLFSAWIVCLNINSCNYIFHMASRDLIAEI